MTSRDLSVEIAEAIRATILSGDLAVGDRLPSEAELCTRFDVSRPTVREALKRLAAQNLIRSQRGAGGGAFVNQMTYEAARADLVTTSTLLMSMNDMDFETACRARFALESAALPLACRNRRDEDLAALSREVDTQRDQALSDEAFCASDVAFHRALVEAAGNPVLTFHAASAIEAMQPLMNMITYTERSRDEIVDLHARLINAVDVGTTISAQNALNDLADYTLSLGDQVRAARDERQAGPTRL